MRIEQVHVAGLRALKARQDSFLDGEGQPHAAVCLRGLNGSGKTTYLTVLAGLWQWFRRCVAKGAYVAPVGLLEEVIPRANEPAFAGMLVSGLPGPCPRLWIALGNVETLAQLTADHEGLRVVDGKPTWDKGLLDWWAQSFERVEAGFEAPSIPNVVFIEAENKWVPELRAGELEADPGGLAFPAIAQYLPTAKGRSHLEGLLLTLFLARPERWRLLKDAIAELRPGLRLLDQFDAGTRRPQFGLPDGTRLTVDLLSAGERSLLINLAMVLRWVGPGGLVLLDEPELHQHLSLMRGSLAVLEALVSSDDIRGQLLVASHAPEVWAHFRNRNALLDIDGVS